MCICCNLQKSPGCYLPRTRICSHHYPKQPQLSQNNGKDIENLNLTRYFSYYLFQLLHYFIDVVNQNFIRYSRYCISNYNST